MSENYISIENLKKVLGGMMRTDDYNKTMNYVKEYEVDIPTDIPFNEDTCVCCGTSVPEGRQVCPSCEASSIRGTRCIICGEFVPISSFDNPVKVCKKCKDAVMSVRGDKVWNQRKRLKS